MTDDAERAEARSLIASLHVCGLSTCGDGQPHAVSLFYAPDGFDLYWFSDPASLHSMHIDATPAARVAVTIASDYHDFADIRGIQMTGKARRLTGPLEIAAGLARLTRRYGFLARSGLAGAIRKAAVYRLTAEQVTFIDNTRGFGHKTTFVITPPRDDKSVP